VSPLPINGFSAVAQDARQAGEAKADECLGSASFIAGIGGFVLEISAADNKAPGMGEEIP